MARRRFFSPHGASWVWSIGAIGTMVLALASGIVFWMSLTNEHSRQFVESERNRSLETIISANSVEASVVDRQRMMRGMVIRGTAESGDVGFGLAKQRVTTLLGLTGSDPQQVPRVRRLSAIIDDQQQGISRTLDDLRGGRMRRAESAIIAGVGEDRVSEVRSIVEAVVARERVVLKDRRELSMQMLRDTETYTYAIAFVGLLVIVLAGTAVAMSVRGVWSDRMREMERSLAEERSVLAERMRIAHVATGAGTWEHDVSTGITEWSAEMPILYGRPSGSAMPTFEEWCEMIHPDDRASAPWCRTGGVGDVSFEVTFRISTPSGGWRWIVSRGFAHAKDGGTSIIGMDVDVTDQVAIREELESVRIERAAEARVREAEEAVRQMQKMETVGQMTGGIAHDFNNMLTPIVGYLDVLMRRHADDDKTMRMLNMALQSADKAKILVSKLLSFSRRQQLESRVIDANALVGEMREFVSKAIAGSGVDVAVAPTDGIACVRVDPNQFENVILNLAVNARDAMPNGGVVRMAVERVASRDQHAGPWPHGLPNGPYVVVSVKDDGIGMDAETLRRAVEPFYTTKGTGKGTGLGLSMAHGMAGQSGGALLLTSQPGAGTTAAVWLPEADSTGLTDIRDEVPTALERGSPMRILLVDDDENVRRSIQQMLIDIGHEVVEASSGSEALARIAQDDGFDMMVTDYLMPLMTGIDLIKKARRTRPTMPVVIVSGYTAVQDHDPIEGVARLAKPFTAARLADAMSRVASRFAASTIGGNVVPMSAGRPRG